MTSTARAVSLLERLVGFDTTSARSNAPLIEFVRAELAAHGVPSRVMMEGDKANLHAIIGPRVAGGIALSAHVDVVPVEGQDWLADPFVLRQEDGRLIGRGATDMKGFLACILAMLPTMLAADLARPFHLCLTHDEETTFRGADRLMDELGVEGPPPALCIVGEPSGMEPIIAHKGYASWGRRDHRPLGPFLARGRDGQCADGRRRGRGLAEGRGAPLRHARPPGRGLHPGLYHRACRHLPQRQRVEHRARARAEFSFEVRSVPGDLADEISSRDSWRMWKPRSCRSCAPCIRTAR